MKVGDIVIATEWSSGYLTKGKEYTVIGFWAEPLLRGFPFIIINDLGLESRCLEFGCATQGGHDWILSPTTHEKVKDDRNYHKII